MTQRVTLPTLVPGLDTLLGGGLTANGLVLLIGAPGAGKTMLATQILFQAARSGARGLIITNASESATKLLAHLESLAFFDASLVGDTITLVPFSSLLPNNSEDIQASLLAAIRHLKVQWVLVDGLQGAAGVLGDTHTIRRLLSTLANLSAYLNLTCLVTIGGAGRDPQIVGELTVADTVLSLEYDIDSWSHVRRIEAIKHRGGAHLDGMHTYTIDAQGCTIVPRLEALPAPPTHSGRAGRADFGLPELDDLFDGGLTTETATVLAGAPGTGKTTLALHWALAGARPTHPTIFVSFSEDAQRLQRKAHTFGLTLDAARTAGSIIVIHVNAARFVPDVVTAAVLAAVTTTDQRVVFDGVGIFIEALGVRARAHLTALATHLASRGATSLHTLEIEPFVGFRVDMKYGSIQPIADNLLVMQYTLAQGKLHYMLAVLKTRFSTYDPTLREVVLTPQGVKVLTPHDTTPGVFQSIEAGGGGISPDRTPTT